MTLRLTSVFIILALLLIPGQVLCAQSDTIWQVGLPDQSYAEFALAGHYSDYTKEFPGGANFEVGQSDPARNWIYVQPGPDAKWAGEGDHPFEVIFDFDTQPTDLYAISFDFVDVSPGPAPSLLVRVNDSAESFELKPGKSRDALTDASKGSSQSLKVYIPGGFMHKGRNVLNVRVASGEYVLYDCIRMYRCVTERPEQLVKKIRVDCPPFFKNNGNELKQILNVGMDLYAAQGTLQVRVTSEQGWQVEQEFPEVANGAINLEVEIPQATKEQNIELEIDVEGRTYKSEAVVKPQKQWKLYLMPLAHFDHGYTHIQDQTLKIHRENTDRAMDWFSKYPGFVWNSENTMLADDYLARGARKDEFLKWTREGRLGVQAFYGNPLSGLCSGEELSEYLNYYDTLRREYGIECKLAVQDDVPTMVGTVPMMLQEHGIKYFAHRVNPIRGPFGDMLDKSPFYWESPDGSKVLSWITTDQTWCMEMTDEATPESLDRTKRVANDFLSKYQTREDYPYDAILVFGAYLDNDVNREQLASVPEAWNKKYAYPQLIYCRGTEFFEYVEANYQDKLQTYRGDGGVYWEDGAASSAKETADTRVAKEKLEAAEKLAALCDPIFQQDTKNAFSQAWKDIVLYDEHTWGGSLSVSSPDSPDTIAQWTVKKSFADNAAKAADDLLTRAMDRFSASIRADNDSVVVFNPSSHVRSETVYFATGSGKQMALQADSVPAVGYKVFPLSSATEITSQPTNGNVLENKYYAIKFDNKTGAVRSIYDKELKRELIDQKTYGANAYLYAHSGNYTSAINFTEIGLEGLRVDECADAVLKKSTEPGIQVMGIQSSAPMANSFSARVVLYDNCKRIDFINTMDKKENLAKEAAYFAFPFTFEKPEVRIDIPGGVIRPEVDQLPSACRDWYAVQDFMTVSDDTASVAWIAIDSPLVTLGDINRGQWYKHLDVKNGGIFAYVMNNYWFTNYKAAQGGPLTFRFSMTSGSRMNGTEAMAFSESVRSPMICKVVNGSDSKDISSHCFVEIDGDGVVLQALKPARFVDGSVLRLREMSGKDTTVRIKLDGIKFKNAYTGNLAEDKLLPLIVKNNVIEVPCKALGLTTIILER